MFSFLFIYTLESKEKRDNFLMELRKINIEKICSGENGCNCYKYLLDDNDDNRIYIVESWINEEAQKIHCEQPHCKIIRSLKEKYNVKSEMRKLS